MTENTNDVVDITIPLAPREGPPLPPPPQPPQPPPPGNPEEYPTIRQSELYATEYKNYPNPGVAVIINNKKFMPETHKGDREGTDRDASNLENRLTELGLEVLSLIDWSDLPKQQLLDKLKAVAAQDHTDNTCFMCAVLTHGDEQGLWAHDAQFKLNEITDLFNARNCTSLLNKPKIFIIQTCRGDGQTEGQLVRVELDDETVSDTLPIIGDAAMEVTPPPAPRPVNILTIPTDMDFLILHSTMEGKTAWRHTEEGTPYIMKLCEELETLISNQQDEDIYTLLHRVNRDVALKFQSQQGGKQMPCFVSMLTKAFKLRPP